MRTTLDLDQALMVALLARHPGLTRTEAIQTAIESYLARDAVARLQELAGTVEIEDVSKERNRDRKA
jgi:hypothetical protein